MIAFASSITDPALYRKAAEPGIRLVAEPDSLVLANAAAGSIFRSYNLILDSVADRADLEALVLLHQDAEIVSPDFCAKLREALRDPDVGVVGCVGAVGVRSIAWWEGSVTWASFTHRYTEFGGGELPALTWQTEDLPAFARTGEVDTVDGFVMALSPWTVRNVRFDESLGDLHGYDLDFCMQVRAARRKVATADLRVVHHHSLDLVSNPETWIAAHMRLAEKWDEQLPSGGAADGDWRRRARRAEAEASLARTEAVAAMMHAEAKNLQLARELAEVTESTSWRATAPLRRLNALRKARRRRR
jgi:Glycosyltransferase like family